MCVYVCTRKSVVNMENGSRKCHPYLQYQVGTFSYVRTTQSEKNLQIRKVALTRRTQIFIFDRILFPRNMHWTTKECLHSHTYSYSFLPFLSLLRQSTLWINQAYFTCFVQSELDYAPRDFFLCLYQHNIGTFFYKHTCTHNCMCDSYKWTECSTSINLIRLLIYGVDKLRAAKINRVEKCHFQA